MRVRTVAVGGALALAALGAVQVSTGGWPSDKPVSSSQAMAKPRKYKLPDKPDERGVVVIQLCWYPSNAAQLSVGWSLGAAGTSVDRVGVPLNCQTPWARKAVLDRGARVTIGYTLITGPVSKFKYRVTVNNRPRVDITQTQGTSMYSCTVGIPPCELP